MKPLYGNGGAAVFKVSERDPNFGSLYDTSAAFREPWVVQRFSPVSRLRVTSVLFWSMAMLWRRGEPACRVVMIFCSNMVRGGVQRQHSSHRVNARYVNASAQP